MERGIISQILGLKRYGGTPPAPNEETEARARMKRRRRANKALDDVVARSACTGYMRLQERVRLERERVTGLPHNATR